MEIRNDIYPTPEAQEYLQALAKRTQEAFPSVFPTVDAVIQYVNNFKKPKIAELFLEIGNYYNAAKFYTCPKCSPPNKIQTCPKCNNTLEIPAFIIIIMIISVMEKLASLESSGVECWVDFYDWVNRRDIDTEYTQVLRKGKFRDFTALIESLKGRWSKEFANLTKITNFLKEIMSSEEKLVIIKSIKYHQTVPELSAQTFTNEEDIKNYVKKYPAKTTEVALPACFEPREYWKCHNKAPNQIDSGYCRDKSNCLIVTDKEKLDKCFKDTIKTIYEWRSGFIHNVQIPPLRGTALYGVRYRGKIAIAELTIIELKPVFEALIKRFFDNYQVPRSKKNTR
jgi:hypothetical protein